MLSIFDLDHTVIDSSHRQQFKANGSLDLDHWRENCTPELIAQDRLLPLSRIMRSHYARGATVLVCTARVMSADDYDYLNRHDLFADAILSRPEGNTQPDEWLKLALLANWVNTSPSYSWNGFLAEAIIFDDNLNVIKTLAREGITCHNSVQFNAFLEA